MPSGETVGVISVPMFGELEQSLKTVAAELPAKPSAVLVISGHWEAPEFKVASAATPGMVYDYHGFPEHTYHVRYPAPGDPALAAEVQQRLSNAGLPCHLDSEQGFDHGAFSLLYPMYPEADVPVVQLSLLHSMDPASHIAAGRALAPLREKNVLIVGSGMSYHNLRLLGPGGAEPSQQFDKWLQQTLVESEPDTRRERLEHWSHAPSARTAHPREDHLLPLMVALGAAEREPAKCIYRQQDLFGGITISSYRFGNLPD